MESDQQIILRMVNDARKDYKTILTDSANKRHDDNLRRGIDTGWIGQLWFWIKLIYSIHHWINK